MSKVLGVIPARLGSERLSRKPLQLLGGRPLIEVVWQRVAAFKVVDALVVATDSDEIAAVCRAAGAQYEMTSSAHRSGTERVAEVAERRAEFDVIVNIQGDEPFVAADHVRSSVQLVLDGWDIGTPAAPIETLDAWRDPAVVKIARADDGRALYFSRSPIPHKRDGVPAADELNGSLYLRHIGVYAYSRAALLKYVRLEETALERSEKLEQLRALAAGMRIGVALTAESAAGIDTPEDLARAQQHFAAAKVQFKI
ncbi:MAG TPA: 3-deoxy-manno-octulosonate cytidylyltransferase [Longimicrobiales bacterium]